MPQEIFEHLFLTHLLTLHREISRFRERLREQSLQKGGDFLQQHGAFVDIGGRHMFVFGRKMIRILYGMVPVEAGQWTVLSTVDSTEISEKTKWKRGWRYHYTICKCRGKGLILAILAQFTAWYHHSSLLPRRLTFWNSPKRWRWMEDDAYSSKRRVFKFHLGVTFGCWSPPIYSNQSI